MQVRLVGETKKSNTSSIDILKPVRVFHCLI
jgi:hypothetical protein